MKPKETIGLSGNDLDITHKTIPTYIQKTLDNLLDRMDFSRGEGTKVLPGTYESKFLRIASKLRSNGYDVIPYYQRYTRLLNDYFKQREVE